MRFPEHSSECVEKWCTTNTLFIATSETVGLSTVFETIYFSNYVWPEVTTVMLAHKTELKVNGRSNDVRFIKKNLEYRFCSINEVLLFIEVFWKQKGVI